MLSLSMIVRNEAERLERCLASVAGFVDEMVVLDTGSSDATIAIAAGCGAVVHQLPMPLCNTCGVTGCSCSTPMSGC
jgi:glycosyltransferase involved in cell wall biosynthesis